MTSKVQENPLAPFVKLSASIYLQDPVEAVGYSGKQPRVIVLAFWMNASSRALVKYVVEYRRLAPSARIVFILSSSNDFMLRASQKAQHARLAPAVEAIQASDRPEGPVFLHMFSNGGVASTTHLLTAYLKATGKPLRVSSMIIDSAPGIATISSGLKAFSFVLPKMWPLRYLSKFLLFVLLAVGYLVLRLTRTPDAVSRARNAINDHGLVRGLSQRKLRGKEGEVDYRYMPDPDLPPLIIGHDLISNLRDSLPTPPDQLIEMLAGTEYGLSIEDAKPLIELDDGARLEYYQDVVDILRDLQQDKDAKSRGGLARMAGNWVLHELGGLCTKADLAWDAQRVPAETLAQIIDQLQRKRITGATAKQVLAMVFDGDRRPVPQLLEEENLLLRPLSRDEYLALAEAAIGQNPQMVEQIRAKNQLGKLGWFVGQMMRMGEKGRVEAQKADEILRELILGKSDQP